MADERLSPKDIELLIASGDLTQDDLALLYQSGDRRGWATAMKLMEQAGKGPDVKAAPLMPPMAVKGMTTIADFIGAATGLPLGGGRKAPSAPKSGPTAKPSTPFVPGGSKTAPSGASTGPRNGSNFERHGNVTSPGPDAHKGGGGPSRPDSPPYNPLDDKRKLDVGPRPGQPDRRQMYEEMKAGIPDPSAVKKAKSYFNTNRQSPSSDFDEAGKRDAMFGGLNQAGDKYVPPNKRGPLSKKDLEQMIANMLRISETMK